MPNKKTYTTHAVIAIATSEDVDTSESEDELKNVQKHLDNKFVINDDSSSNEPSDTEEENNQRASKSKKKKRKRMQWIKKPFVPPTSTFSGSIPPSPPPPITSELKPIDYFCSMFGKDSFQFLKEQSNLYSVQVNPNRPLAVSETEIRQFIGILIMTGVYSFPEQRFF